MSVIATELKNNLGKYLVLSAKSLFGILPVDADVNEAKRERQGIFISADFHVMPL